MDITLNGYVDTWNGYIYLLKVNVPSSLIFLCLICVGLDLGQAKVLTHCFKAPGM